jgi:hypothetical protein
MRSTSRWARPRRAALVTAVALVAGGTAAAGALAQGQPVPSNLTLVPTEDTAPSGTCNEFTARVTGFDDTPGGAPVQGVTVDVLQTLQSRGNEPGETRELAFCNPQNTTGANPTGSGGTSFGDVTGNNPGETAGDFGRNTSVHGEVGPTDANGEVTFGITMTPPDAAGTVTVTAWYELEDDDEEQVEADPADSSTKTWVANEGPPVTGLDAAPEASSNPTGTQHTVTVVVSNGGNPLQGVVPNSVITADATGRPAGDVANPGAGASPNFVPGRAKPAAYTCTVSDAQGFSTCTFQDPAGTPAGTDTIVFFVSQGGEAGEPDGADPQDAVQKTWVAPGTQTPPPTATPTPTPTPTPSPGPATPEARNVRLCHGSTAGTTCDTTAHARGPGNLHEVAALVTDRAGNALAGVPVELRETGPAVFTPAGASTVLVTTGSDGIARAVLTSDHFGTSTIVAEISPPGTTGSFRGPGAADDECEQPAGSGAPGAGNCLSQALTVTWEDIHPAECSDERDNDGDGFTDYPDDPGCEDEGALSELPFNGLDEAEMHGRRINMRFRDWVGPSDEGLVIFGRLRLSNDDDRFRKCTQQMPVNIQRLVDGRWLTKKSVTTNARGRYAGVVFDLAGRYRAVAPRTEILIEDTVRHMCRKAAKAKTHHHRR